MDIHQARIIINNVEQYLKKYSDSTITQAIKECDYWPSLYYNAKKIIQEYKPLESSEYNIPMKVGINEEKYLQKQANKYFTTTDVIARIILIDAIDKLMENK